MPAPVTLEQHIAAVIAAVGADIKAINIAIAAFGASISQGQLDAAITGLRNELRGGAGAALDSFVEIEARLQADASLSTALATAIANRVRYDDAQVLSPAEKATARSNIGAADAEAIGNPVADLVALYTAAKQ